MRRAPLLLIASAALLLAAAGGAWLAAAGGWLTGPLTGRASAWFGRAVAADGGLRIRVGAVTRITAEGVRLANLPWGARPAMLTARRVVVELDTRSLLEPTLVVHAVRVEGADLLLERRADGAANWVFELPPRDVEADALPVVVERVELPGARVRFTTPRLAAPLDIALTQAGQVQRADGMLEVTASGTANALPVTLTAELGPLAALVAARDIGFRVDGGVGEVALAASGRIDRLVDPVDTLVNLRLRGPDAAYVTTALGVRNLGDGPFDLSGSLAPAPGGAGLRGEARGTVGEFRLAVRGYLDPRPEPAALGIQARVSGPDLSLAGGIAGIHGLPVAPFHLAFDARRGAEGEVDVRSGELALDEGWLRIAGVLREGAAASRLQVQAGGADFARLGARLGWPALPAGAFTVEGSAGRKAGAIDVELTGTTPLGRFKALVVPPAGGGLDGTRLQLEAGGADFRPLGRLLALAAPPGGAYRLAGNARIGAAAVGLDGVVLTVGGDELRVDGSVARAAQLAGTRVRVALKGPDAARTGALERLAGLAPGVALPAGPFRVAGRLERDGPKLRLTGLQASAAGARATGALEVAGSAAFQPRFETTGLRLQGRAASLQALGQALGRQWPDLPVELRMRFNGTGADFDLDELEGRLGASDFSGRMGVRARGATRDVELAIDSCVVDLRELLGAGGPAGTAKRRRGNKDLVIPARPLGLPDLEGNSGTLTPREEAPASTPPVSGLPSDGCRRLVLRARRAPRLPSPSPVGAASAATHSPGHGVRRDPPPRLRPHPRPSHHATRGWRAGWQRTRGVAAEAAPTAGGAGPGRRLCTDPCAR